jgi:hypothetical protein
MHKITRRVRALVNVQPSTAIFYLWLISSLLQQNCTFYLCFGLPAIYSKILPLVNVLPSAAKFYLWLMYIYSKILQFYLW